MSFTEQLSDFTAAEIIDAIGCERGTAYDWKSGRRRPPSWQHRHWLKIIRSHQKKTTKPKKASHGAPGKRSKKSGI